MTSYAYRCSDCGAQRDWAYPIGFAPRYIDCWAIGCDGLAYKLVTAPSVHFGTGASRSSYGARTHGGKE